MKCDPVIDMQAGRWLWVSLQIYRLLRSIY